MIAWAAMGDANASIPTPQPVLPRPMFGAAPGRRGRHLGALRRAAGHRGRPGRPDRRAAGDWSPVAQRPHGRQGRHAAQRRDCRPSRSIPTPSPSASTARCGASNRPPNCPWRRDTSCSDGRPGRPLLALADSRLPDRRPRPFRRRRGGRHQRAGGRSGDAARRSCAAASGPRPGDGVRRRRGARRPTRRPPTPTVKPMPAHRLPRRGRRRAAQGRGLLRLARRVWPADDWAALGRSPHLPVVGRTGGPRQRPDTRADRAVAGVHHDDGFGHGRAAAAGARPGRRGRGDVRAVGVVRAHRRRGRPRARRPVRSSARRAGAAARRTRATLLSPEFVS